MAISIPVNKERGLARNGVQTLECSNKDILNRKQRHPGTQSTMGGGRESGSVYRADSPHRTFPERGSTMTCM